MQKEGWGSTCPETAGCGARVKTERTLPGMPRFGHSGIIGVGRTASPAGPVYSIGAGGHTGCSPPPGVQSVVTGPAGRAMEVYRQDGAWTRFILPADQEVAATSYKSGENYGAAYTAGGVQGGRYPLMRPRRTVPENGESREGCATVRWGDSRRLLREKRYCYCLFSVRCASFRCRPAGSYRIPPCQYGHLRPSP